MADIGNYYPCSNISIIQLFHELKQKYPTVPDQIVSKIIQKNCHDKSTCEAILEKENHAHLSSYPKALISKNCNNCTDKRFHSHPLDASPRQSSCDSYELAIINNNNSSKKILNTEKNSLLFSDKKNVIDRRKSLDDLIFLKECPGRNKKLNLFLKPEENNLHIKRDEKDCVTDGISGFKGSFMSQEEDNNDCSRQKLNLEFTMSKNNFLKCDNDKKKNFSVRSLTCNAENNGEFSKSKTIEWKQDTVEVQYSMHPSTQSEKGRKQKSSTTVNLSLRPPSSHTHDSNEMKLEKNFTYTTSSFDEKKGIQSEFKIIIAPGGTDRITEFRDSMSFPQMRYLCRSSNCTSQITCNFFCRCSLRLKALLEKQRQQKYLLAEELRKEQEKLFSIKNEIKLMKTFITQKNNLPVFLKDVDKLRIECKKLAYAVDLYSDTQNFLPLGETNEEFYNNIYTGQVLQREEYWNCQLCTFRNHPLLNVCEECEMPRIILGIQKDVESNLPVCDSSSYSTVILLLFYST
ncbi:hypothetical protein Phum_PHUM268290 [Pediculus humanus corporis]|uniref:RanBP2-type domain-containing protein n=1 Tax=Pediculus humanus subsp. corporis TaxID=121224 RepID=E0VKP0_PEDHC|nr:uncharacterized protein Phum_PHUM268290 [Pediculus humanus corporis]EEB13946.1 hypothetical protein Phum_PHUM268290 [Pediculus humanus corporis]